MGRNVASLLQVINGILRCHVALVPLANQECARYRTPVASSIGEIIGDNVKRLRLALRDKPSQEALGEIAGISRSTVARLENHTLSSVDAATLARLAHALSVPADELLAERDRGYLNTAISEYEHSDWKRAQKPSKEELLWLRQLPGVIWMDAHLDAKAIADLLEWHRAHQKKK